MNWDQLLLEVNAVVCSITVIRLLLFRRHKFNIPYHLGYSIFSYAMIVINGTIVIRILTGEYTHIDWSTVLNNTFICVALLYSGGSIKKLLRGERSAS